MFNFIKKLFSTKEDGNLSRKGTGYFRDVPDVRDIPLSEAQKPVVIPDAHKTDLSMFSVFDQMYLGTCVAHAMVMMKMYQEYIETKKIIIFSRRILYILGRALCGLTNSDPQGLYPRVTAKALTDVGVVPDKGIDNNNLSHTTYTSYQILPIDKENAKQYKVKGYAFPDVSDVTALMQAIYQNGVVTIGIDFDQLSWFQALLKKITKAVSGHYVLLYGYEKIGDDVKFFFRNSWGALWGNQGNGEFLYSEYKTHIYDAIVFTDLPNDLIEKAKQSKYIFLRTLKKGMSGEDVLQLQKYLVDIGIFDMYKPTGYFGTYTDDCVIEFQQKNNLSPDGIFGPKCIALVNGTDTNKKTSLIDKWCQITEKIEGAKPELNNPGNIKYIGQKSATGKDYRGFCIFPDYQTGYMELRNLFVRACSGQSSNYKADMTLEEFYSGIEMPNRYGKRISGYAPASDKNQPSIYAQSVAKYLGVSKSIQIKELL